MFNEIGVLFLSSICIPAVMPSQQAGDGVADTPFVQEYHEPHVIGDDAAANDIRAVAVDSVGNVWAATKAGAYCLKKGEKTWRTLMGEDEAGPAFDVCAGAGRAVWIGAWNGLYEAAPDGFEKVEAIDQPISAVYATETEVLAAGPEGLWRRTDDWRRFGHDRCEVHQPHLRWRDRLYGRGRHQPIRRFQPDL